MSKSILLYRYLSADAGVKTLEKRAFRVSRLAELNDPFEFSLGVDGNSPKIVQRHKEFFQYINDKYGVICFSQTISDPVIWSHYANSHRGLAIEVDHDLNTSLLKVIYSKERPLVPSKYALDPEKHLDELRPIFEIFSKHKSPSWAYEKEYRGLAELGTCTVGEGMFFLPIPPDLVTRVIIGARSSISPMYIRRVLDMMDLKEVRVCRASLSCKTYDVEIHECAGL